MSSKTIFMTVIALATILSLSVFANAFAASDDNNNNKPSADQGTRDAINNAPHSGDKPRKITTCFGPCDNNGGGNGGSSSSHHRSHQKGHSSSSDNGIITSPTVLGDNSAATAIATTPQLTIPLQIVNSTVFKNTDTYDIIGKVLNDGSDIASVVTVNVQYFDAQGNLLGENSDGADGIPPGQTKAFRISAVPAVIEGMPISMIDHYTITATEMK